MFQCLQEHLAEVDFSAACREQVEDRWTEVQSDYRLDYGVSEACEGDVKGYCADAAVRLPATRDAMPVLTRDDCVTLLRLRPARRGASASAAIYSGVLCVMPGADTLASYEFPHALLDIQSPVDGLITSPSHVPTLQRQGRVHGKAEVLRCLIGYHDHLTNECAKETSRAARLALWDYQVIADCAFTAICSSSLGLTLRDMMLSRKRPARMLALHLRQL